MWKFTKEQQQALLNLCNGQMDKPISYLAFRRSAFLAYGDCMMVPWCGMLIGIEADGYAHS